jgi:hypothetical protein
VSHSTVLAALVTLPVTFFVFFAAVAGPNAAAGVTGALLAYVLPAASPGSAAMIPDRLAGWWLAAVVGTAAVLALPTPTAGDGVRGAAAKLAHALAEQLEAMLRGEAVELSLQAALSAKIDLMAKFSAGPSRPTGLGAADQALANGVELLEWCTALVADSARERGDLRGAPESERDLLAGTACVLRQSGELFAGSGGLSAGGGQAVAGSVALPELERLDDLRRRSLAQASRLRSSDPDFESNSRLSFHAHAISVAVLSLGADALMASGVVDQEWLDAARTRWLDAETLDTGGRFAAVSRYSAAAARHASLRSVWFVNSLRGALALAAAIAVADLSGVQHGFWVVLGTLSVLRTNAGATGATALRALLGTAIGFAVGGALLLAIGSSTTALWVVLPIAVLIAAYSPGTAPFAVGQAAFTVTVAVLFNLLVPVGWKVGAVRIEDVALGCAVSVFVGTLFWPRGVASVVGDDLADAYRAGAAYLREAVRWVSGTRGNAPAGGRSAFTAGLRLDAAVRGFLAEQGTKRLPSEELWRLIGGSLRLRLTAHAVAELPRDCAKTSADDRVAIIRRADALSAWYEELATCVATPRDRIIQLEVPHLDGNGAGDPVSSSQALWLREHLDHLGENLAALHRPALDLAAIRREPWWR